MIHTLAERYFRYELAVSLFNELRSIPVLGVMAVVLIYSIFVYEMQSSLTLVWAIIMVALYGVGWIGWLRSGCRPTQTNYKLWSLRVVAWLTCIAIGWSILSALVISHVEGWQELSFVLIMLALVTLPVPAFNHCLPILLLNAAVILTVTFLSALYKQSYEENDVWMTGIIFLSCTAGFIFLHKNIRIATELIKSVDSGNKVKQQLQIISGLEYEKNHDPITGLLNNYGLESVLESANHINSNQYVIMAKVKRVADYYASNSRNIAESLISKIGEELKKIKNDGEFIAHNGLGEFVLTGAYREDKPKSVIERAKTVTEAFNVPIDLGDQVITVHSAVGIAQTPVHGRTVNSLPPLAMTAMQSALEKGGTAIKFYSPEMSDSVSRALLITNALAGALSNNEFQLYFQPKVHLMTGGVIGAEALIRWRHGKLGWISPAEFIPVAESTGDILSIGRWIVNQCKAISYELPDDFKVAINVSLKQFDDNELFDLLASVAREWSDSNRKLELEITESTLMSDSKIVEERLRLITESGISIALDDFGTGYSSLSYLSRLNIDTIKLDKTFIDPVTHHGRHAKLVSSVIHLANELSLDLVAEGVETQEQVDWLKKNGCTIVQGYHFSKPLPMPEFLEWLSQSGRGTN